MLEPVYLIVIESLFVMVSGLLLLLYSARIRKVLSEERMATDILSSIVGSLEKKIHDKDERLLDLLYRVDLLESRLQLSSEWSPSEQRGSGWVGAESKKLMLEGKVTKVVRRDITVTNIAILKVLHSGPKTSRDIQKYLGKSREHVARIMKGLYEGGYVTRSEEGKPFVYDLTESGRSLANEL